MRHSILVSALLLISLSGASLEAGPVMSGLSEWYEANTGALNSSSTTATSGQGVQTWQNQSAGGSTFDVSQATAANQPNYNPSGLNGHPALIFTDNRAGSYSVLDNLSVNALAANSSRTVFVVAQATDTAGGTLFTSRISDPVDTMQRFDAGPHYIYSDGATTNITTSNGPGSAAFISTYIQNSTTGAATTGTAVGTLAAQFNGVTETLTSGNTVPSESSGGTGFSIGDRLDNVGPATLHQGWTGAIAEVLVYDRVLTPDEINQTGFYLAQKYGLATAYTAPEPSSIVLLLAGAAGLCFWTRRKAVA